MWSNLNTLSDTQTSTQRGVQRAEASAYIALVTVAVYELRRCGGYMGGDRPSSRNTAVLPTAAEPQRARAGGGGGKEDAGVGTAAPSAICH